MIFWLAMIVAFYAAGCEKRGEGYYLSDPTTVFVKKPAAVSMGVSQDPDDRAAAIVSWSKNDWGLRGSYLQYYAMILNSDESPIVRSAAARALGKAGDTQYLPTLIAALANDQSATVRWDAAEALDNVLGDEAVSPLQQAALHDKSADVRIASIKALRNYPKDTVIKTLLTCLGDQPFGVNYQAHASLVELTHQDSGFEPENWKDIVGKPLPPVQPKKVKKPWWDLAGNAQKQASSQPTSQPASGPASLPAGTNNSRK